MESSRAGRTRIPAARATQARAVVIQRTKNRMPGIEIGPNRDNPALCPGVGTKNALIGTCQLGCSLTVCRIAQQPRPSLHHHAGDEPAERARILEVARQCIQRVTGTPPAQHLRQAAERFNDAPKADSRNKQKP